ncbi:hypothetical protein [Paenibacillus alba]|uniref:Uncharacterized protein n=1 Tax=Paenibacillus alba TaxID=1197127 RepID=A0ABU6GAD7_9BACL|nr:hypothetical protein [Paenibacillus alba]MEC0231155.1 hypothetical protein [Paenibacillus alba]
MGKDEKVPISTLVFSRDLAEKITLCIKKNQDALTEKKQGA